MIILEFWCPLVSYFEKFKNSLMTTSFLTNFLSATITKFENIYVIILILNIR